MFTGTNIKRDPWNGLWTIPDITVVGPQNPPAEWWESKLHPKEVRSKTPYWLLSNLLFSSLHFWWRLALNHFDGNRSGQVGFLWLYRFSKGVNTIPTSIHPGSFFNGTMEPENQLEKEIPILETVIFRFHSSNFWECSTWKEPLEESLWSKQWDEVKSRNPKIPYTGCILAFNPHPGCQSPPRILYIFRLGNPELNLCLPRLHPGWGVATSEHIWVLFVRWIQEWKSHI